MIVPKGIALRHWNKVVIYNAAYGAKAIGQQKPVRRWCNAAGISAQDTRQKGAVAPVYLHSAAMRGRDCNLLPRRIKGD